VEKIGVGGEMWPLRCADGPCDYIFANATLNFNESNLLFYTQMRARARATLKSKASQDIVRSEIMLRNGVVATPCSVKIVSRAH
jgi:hypothetical protein